MRTDDFNFDLPEELIAQHPLEQRDHSRLLVLDKHSGNITHKRFDDILDYLVPGDVLVVNNTRVIPARLFGMKEGGTAHIEVLLLKPVENQPDHWEVLVRPGKRVKVGAKVVFGEGKMTGTVVDDTDTGRIMKFEYEGIFNEILDELGTMPLPPYIKAKLDDQERYQTVYAKERGSAAAPTAGLHFTKELLAEVKARGIEVVEVLLHVGLGTFRPVQVDDIHSHKMHSEYYRITQDAADTINKALDEGRRVIAVGTTSTRTLESAAKDGRVVAGDGDTSIFIYPGYQFQVLSGLITNFHLPKSTLVMLVSALAGREHVLHAYEEAVKERYRFFSFGDAMFIADVDQK
ncbi:MAG: tRNA preQ1(34) S-adenosylmethionine ribosyltransferase-isomerase QueA [Peptococcaceae bacterium]|nr:tRNA preQ1(34) S-adenosylmethionine ribosyltransferase-isomerase QueA [Peptococcaceae bacterium]MBQ5667860.1 tRNA preQ1(34) S-adenosylmethionine ribosyltransferase-isomerase QueA [Peptococcaceae bacterium]MBQ5707421.1 tRNA preQ1(34) S-adenosylmethionine ribosyltransferase-isomerase QueA [Peptococcaceae bacterium]